MSDLIRHTLSISRRQFPRLADWFDRQPKGRRSELIRQGLEMLMAQEHEQTNGAGKAGPTAEEIAIAVGDWLITAGLVVPAGRPGRSAQPAPAIPADVLANLDDIGTDPEDPEDPRIPADRPRA